MIMLQMHAAVHLGVCPILLFDSAVTGDNSYESANTKAPDELASHTIHLLLTYIPASLTGPVLVTELDSPAF